MSGNGLVFTLTSAFRGTADCASFVISAPARVYNHPAGCFLRHLGLVWLDPPPPRSKGEPQMSS